MVVDNSVSMTMGRIADFLKINGARYAANLTHIATQKRFNKPSENIADYFRSQQLSADTAGYLKIQEEINDAAGMLNVGETAATSIYDDIKNMKHLTQQYYKAETTTEEKTALRLQFDTIKNRVTATIAATTYNGRELITDTSSGTPLKSVLLDPNDTTAAFDIDFDDGDVADVSLSDIAAGESAALNAIDAELVKAGSYLAKTSGYLQGLDSQGNIIQDKIDRYKDLNGAISGADQASEVAQMIKYGIAQQASMAMFAQAGIERKHVLALFRI